MWVVLAVAIYALRDRGWLLATVFLLLPVIELLGGASAISFRDVVAKAIPPRSRGDFCAWRLTSGAILAVGAGPPVRQVLDERGPLGFPQNFGLLFALTTVCASAGMLPFGLIKEPPGDNLTPRASLSAQLPQARVVVAGDSNYRRYLRLRAALMLAGAAAPFFAVYARERFEPLASLIGVYLAAYTAAGLVANFLYARIARRAGHRRSVTVACLAGLGMACLTLVVVLLGTPLGLARGAVAAAFVIIFVLSGTHESGIGVAGNGLLLDLAPPGQGPLYYVGIAHSTLGLVLLVAAGTGVVVATLGYLPLFVAAALAHLLAVWDAYHLGEPAAALDLGLSPEVASGAPK